MKKEINGTRVSLSPFIHFGRQILKVNEEGTPQKHKTATKCDVSLFKIKFQYKLGLIQQHSAVF